MLSPLLDIKSRPQDLLLKCCALEPLFILLSACLFCPPGGNGGPGGPGGRGGDGGHAGNAGNGGQVVVAAQDPRLFVLVEVCCIELPGGSLW